MRLYGTRLRSAIALVCTGTLVCAAPSLAFGQGGRSAVPAQPKPPAIVHVQVTQAAGTPLADADLIVLKSGAATLLGRSDANGRHTFLVDIDTGRYSLAVRKLGFTRTLRLLPIAPGDTFAITVAVARAPAELDTIRATAQQLPSKNYFLGGDEIMASTRGIFDALDALQKLRPNMLGDGGRVCPGVRNIWINGRREYWGSIDDPFSTEMSAPSGGRGRVSRPRTRGVTKAPKMTEEPDGVDTVLMWLKPEHIAEMRYVNCWDMSMPEIGTNDALYIVLKPGVKFVWGKGTVVDSSYVPAPLTKPPR